MSHEWLKCGSLKVLGWKVEFLQSLEDKFLVSDTYRHESVGVTLYRYESVDNCIMMIIRDTNTT